MKELASEKESQRAREKESKRQRARNQERVYTILECRKLKGRSLYVHLYSDITRFHTKCQDPPQGRGLKRGIVRDRE